MKSEKKLVEILMDRMVDKLRPGLDKMRQISQDREEENRANTKSYRSRSLGDGYFLVDGYEVDRNGLTRDGLRYFANAWGWRNSEKLDITNSANAAASRARSLEEYNQIIDAAKKEIDEIDARPMTDEEEAKAQAFLQRVQELAWAQDELDAQQPRLSPTQPFESNLPTRENPMQIDNAYPYDDYDNAIPSPIVQEPNKREKPEKKPRKILFNRPKSPEQNDQSMTTEDKRKALDKLNKSYSRNFYS